MVNRVQQLPISVMVSILTLLFIIAQISYYGITLATAGTLHILIKHAVTIELIKSKSVLWPVIGYLAAQLVIYTLFIYTICLLTNITAEVTNLTKNNLSPFAIINSLLAIYLIISLNAIYFPLSVFAFNINQPIVWLITYKHLFYLCAVLISFQAILYLFVLTKRLITRSVTRQDTLNICLITVAAFIISNLPTTVARLLHHHQPHQQPNIILISIEALRPDFIKKPYHQTVAMPFLTSQLDNSINFTDAYTPIAQSFPSWISLLTAKTPMHNGSRSLYTNYQEINLSESLTHSLKNAGYQTFYAVDGQRFGDITGAIGFDHIISPPYGAAELLIGSISDFPLSNLFVTTRIGKWLFPYSYGNRSIIATYHPRNFNELIDDGLEHRNDKPLFIGVHFGLSHWPFRWGNDHLNDDLSMPDKYAASLHTADKQIKAFFKTLEREKIIDNAIIVFISDHGIGLGMPGDKLTSEESYEGIHPSLLPFYKQPYSIAVKNKKSGIDTSYGYSTDILSLNQYHILMAMKGVGFTDHEQAIGTRVSLMDITPTLLSMLHLSPFTQADGKPLTALLSHQLPNQPIRDLYLENGFTTPEIAAVNISINKVLQSSMQSVQLEPETGLLYINREAEKSLLKNKQRAILAGDWLLARYPDFYRKKLNTTQQTYSVETIHVPTTFILVNIRNRKWTTDLHSVFASHAPVKELMDKFKEYNRNEI